MQSRFQNSEGESSCLRAFLSFATKDEQLVDEFRKQLESRYANLALLDHAVRNRYDKNWKVQCAEKIDKSNVLICLVGTTTHTSESVAWEIDRGLTHGKRVYAINLMNHQVRLPEVLIRNTITPMSQDAIFASST